jgi:Uma2 family endonuclease
MATTGVLMTAEEFGRRPDPGHPEELVRGRIVAMPPPDRVHGKVCTRTAGLLDRFVAEYDLGHVMSNASGVITERNPDTVRGADVAYYSYARLPKGPLKPGYGPEVPELVFEVRSAAEPWRKILRKVVEYLMSGALKVVVLNPESRQAHVFSPEEAPEVLGPEEELTFPGLLDGFRVPVHRFFD